MQFCMPHWTALREAIAKRGLGALVADSGEKAAANLQREVIDGPSIDSYDPLMAAHNAITSNAMDILGPLSMQLMTGPYCPICFVDEQVKARLVDGKCGCGCGEPYKSFDWSIERAADDQVEVWKELSDS